MKCTQCSKPVKPIVALDIDGTLGDYHGHFINFAQGYFGMMLPRHEEYDGSQPFWKFLGLDLRDYRDAKLAYRQGGLKRTIPMYHYADRLAADLRASGAELWIATTRPYNRMDNIDPDTQEWLRRNRIPYDHLIYGDTKYDQLSEMVDPARVVATLDDLPEHYEVAERLGLNPILRENHHNRAWREGEGLGAHVVDSLQRAAGLLVARVHGWYDKHRQQAQEMA